MKTLSPVYFYLKLILDSKALEVVETVEAEDKKIKNKIRKIWINYDIII